MITPPCTKPFAAAMGDAWPPFTNCTDAINRTLTYKMNYYDERGKFLRRWYTDSALDILRERYARGELSKEEFKERKQNLN